MSRREYTPSNFNRWPQCGSRENDRQAATYYAVADMDNNGRSVNMRSVNASRMGPPLFSE